jgi:hypothetical protein
VPPTFTTTGRSLSKTASFRATSMPATTSAWPFRNFVMLWRTMSAPCSSGRWRTGLQKVLSTQSRASCAWAISAARARSVISMVGFVGVST